MMADPFDTNTFTFTNRYTVAATSPYTLCAITSATDNGNTFVGNYQVQLDTPLLGGNDCYMNEIKYHTGNTILYFSGYVMAGSGFLHTFLGRLDKTTGIVT